MITKEQFEWIQNNLNFTDIKDMLDSSKTIFVENQIVPTLVMAGRTGAGKSSLINAVVGRHVSAVGVIPTTQEVIEQEVNQSGVPLILLDLPGIGEAGKHDQRMRTLLGQLDRAHVMLLVLGCPDRSMDYECSLLNEVQKYYAGRLPLPLLIAGTKIDCATPIRNWSPESLNLTKPETEKEKNITDWLRYSSSILQPFMGLKDTIVPCASGQAYNDTTNQYGIEVLRHQIFECLPEAAQTYFARLVQDHGLIDKRAAKIVRAYSAMAGAAATQPIPAVPDAALIMPIQIAMLIQLTRLHGKELTKDMATKLLGPFMARMAGRFAFEQICKFIPGVGSAMGAAVATSMTYALGMGYHTLLHGGCWEFDGEMLKQEILLWWNKKKD